MKITTDYKWKRLKYGYEVPQKILNNQFDYMRDDEKSDGFIVYRKRWYHLNEFMRIDENSPLFMLGYHGYIGDSYFSGILIRLSDDGESYQIATYIS